MFPLPAALSDASPLICSFIEFNPGLGGRLREAAETQNVPAILGPPPKKVGENH